MAEEKKVETKPLTFGAEEVAKMMKEALAEGIALASQLNKAEKAPAPAAAPVQSKRRCGECGQKNMACGGEHRLAVVWPQDRRAAKVFSGVKINGMRYRSNGPGHMVTVPKNCDIEYQVAEFERKEVEAYDGKEHHRHSGSIGGTNNFNAYNGGDWGKK